MTLAALHRMPSHTLARARYSPNLLARVAAGWRRIAADERQGIAAAAHIAADLAALNAPPAILSAAARVIADEVHHLDVCACVLDELDPSGRRRGVRGATSRRLDLTPRAPVGEHALACTLVADYACSAKTAGQPHDHEAEGLGLLPSSSDCRLPSWILPHLEPLGFRARPANGPALVH
jgi:hypothetical protein